MSTENTTPVATQPETLAQAICKVLGRQHPDTMPDHVILACIENMRRRSECLGAIEREFFMVTVPADEEEDGEGATTEECLLRWGADPAEYVEQFRGALAQVQAAATAAQPIGYVHPVAVEHLRRGESWGTELHPQPAGVVSIPIYLGAAQVAPQPLTPETIKRHTLRAGECPAGTEVLLVSSVLKLFGVGKGASHD